MGNPSRRPPLPPPLFAPPFSLLRLSFLASTLPSLLPLPSPHLLLASPGAYRRPERTSCCAAGEKSEESSDDELSEQSDEDEDGEDLVDLTELDCAQDKHMGGHELHGQQEKAESGSNPETDSFKQASNGESSGSEEDSDGEGEGGEESSSDAENLEDLDGSSSAASESLEVFESQQSPDDKARGRAPVKSGTAEDEEEGRKAEVASRREGPLVAPSPSHKPATSVAGEGGHKHHSDRHAPLCIKIDVEPTNKQIPSYSLMFSVEKVTMGLRYGVEIKDRKTMLKVYHR